MKVLELLAFWGIILDSFEGNAIDTCTFPYLEMIHFLVWGFLAQTTLFVLFQNSLIRPFLIDVTQLLS